MQLCRQGYQPLVLEKARAGGLLWNANLVENYPGFVNGISGPDLVQLFQDQAQRLGVEVRLEEVRRASYQDGIFQVQTAEGEYRARILVAASGTAPQDLPPGIIAGGISSRVYSEVASLAQLSGQEIVILGAGDAALDYALNLSRKNTVRILNRGNQVKALGLLWERAQARDSIVYCPQSELISAGPDGEGRIQLIVSQSGTQASYAADYLLLAIGRKPEFSYADESIIEGKARLTADRKLFLIGDLVNGLYRQTSIAVGDGIKAALTIAELLDRG